MPIQWVPLKISDGPYFARQVEAIIQTYVESAINKEDRAVRYLRNAIQNKVDELEYFISTVDEDSRCVIFEKQSRRLRKLLQVRAEEYVTMISSDGYLDVKTKLAQSNDHDQRLNIRGSIHETDLGSPSPTRGEKGRNASSTPSRNIDNSYSISDDSHYDLPLPAGVDLEAKADERTVLGNRRDGGLIDSQGPKTPNKKIYPWERGADTGEDIVGPPHERIPPGGTFALQFVMDQKEHQHYEARRRIRNLQLEYAMKHNGSGRQNRRKQSKVGQYAANVRQKSAIKSYSALRAGPYVEPSYNAAQTHRHYDKDKHIGIKAWTTHI